MKRHFKKYTMLQRRQIWRGISRNTRCHKGDKYGEIAPDENNAGAISMQVSKPVKSFLLQKLLRYPRISISFSVSFFLICNLYLLINCFSLSSAAFFRFEPTWRISTWALSRSSRTTLCSLAIKMTRINDDQNITNIHCTSMDLSIQCWSTKCQF